MKYLFSLLATTVMALDLSSGIYNPFESNNDSICPQKITTEKLNGETLLKVFYIGDCYDQGPYQYYCIENICTDGQIDYQIDSDESFLWLNKKYQIWGKFKKE